MYVTPWAQNHRGLLLNQRTGIPAQPPFKALVNICKTIHAAFPENRTRHPVQSLPLFSTRIFKQDVALNRWTAHSTRPQGNCNKKNPCSMQCLYYIFKSNLHFLHFWGIEMLEAGWLDCLKVYIHLPPCLGSFQVLDKHSNHSALLSLELSPQGLFQHTFK